MRFNLVLCMIAGCLGIPRVADATILFQQLPDFLGGISSTQFGGQKADDFVPVASGWIDSITFYGSDPTTTSAWFSLYSDDNGLPASPHALMNLHASVTAVTPVEGHSGFYEFTADGYSRVPQFFVEEGTRYHFSVTRSGLWATANTGTGTGLSGRSAMYDHIPWSTYSPDTDVAFTLRGEEGMPGGIPEPATTAVLAIAAFGLALTKIRVRRR